MRADRTFEVYLDADDKWRWRARAKNGRITMTSGESFDSYRNAHKAVYRELAALDDGTVSIKELP